jgi:phage regulator Rha-like protein
MSPKRNQIPEIQPAQLIPQGKIEQQIFLIRSQKVMLDSDLAKLYGVPTYRLNEAVKRNRSRFPEDFMLQLTKEKADALTSHFAMSKTGRGGRRTLPYAFTEHGVAMLSSVLNSERAVEMNILIIRAFVRLREILATHKNLAHRMEELERKQQQQGVDSAAIYNLVQRLMGPQKNPRRPIGFVAREK